ncbi:hypothetical protein JQX13_34505 [Archangium violaceum]|uniref:hypothetical protein n=1 Tax=Archangium violaceum TaxID=83451 RepID=UPI00193B9681|nr:hypothetical protein [Archangium violaceum]QRK05279.1 hypothetical protein JQX13_34505 [Archangium violaceum]
MGSEFSQLMRLVAALIREREETRAFEQLQSARQQAALERYARAQEAIMATNLAVLEAQRGRDQVLAEIQRLPPAERAGVEARLMPLVDRVFHDELARLKSLKRQLANPRSSLRKGE